jgi:hypothetical protein
MAHPPFAFNMILASNADHTDVGLDLGPLTLQDPAQRVVFTAQFLVGFGWTAYPRNYRSSAALGWDEVEQ